MNQPGNRHQPVILQDKGICPHQKSPPDMLRPWHPLQPGRQHPDWVIAPQLRLL